MNNFIFAFNAVTPIFLVAFLGMFLRKINILSDALIKDGNALCFKVLFPIMVFNNLYMADAMNPKYSKVFIFSMATIIICVLLGIAFVPRFVKDRNRIGVIIQALYRGNYMLFGLPFAKILGGEECAALATSLMIATLPLLNIFGVVLLQMYSDKGGKMNFKKLLGGVLKNPIVQAVIVGVIFSYTGLQAPVFLQTALSDLSKIGTPLAFIFLGGQFEFEHETENIKQMAVVLIFKLIIIPIIVLSAAIGLFDIRGIELIPIFVLAASPGAVTSYQMAIQYNADYKFAGNFIIYSMLFSSFTFFGFIFALKNLALI